MERLTTGEYFLLPESTRPMELVYGVVREPPAPRYGHQSIVTRLTRYLDTHVSAHGLGEVCVSPVDVVSGCDVDQQMLKGAPDSIASMVCSACQ